MTARFSYRAMIVVIVACCFCNVGCDNREIDQAKATWDGYAAAVLAGDGPRAAMHITNSTKDYYERMRLAALQSGRDELARMSFIDRFMISAMRVQMDLAYLRTLNGEQTFMVAVQNGLIDPESVKTSAITDIEIDGETATAAYVVRDEKTPYRIQMVKEDGLWKLNLVALLEATGRDLPAALRKQLQFPQMTEDELILTLLSVGSGSQVGPEIWDKPKSR